MYNIRCKICGKEFSANRSDAKTCSGRCRTALSRRRKQQSNKVEVDQCVTDVTLVTPNVTLKPEMPDNSVTEKSNPPILDELMELLSMKLDQVNDHLKGIRYANPTAKLTQAVLPDPTPIDVLPMIEVKQNSSKTSQSNQNLLKSIMAL